MAVTILGTQVNWNDGTTTSTASQSGKISSVDTQSGVFVSTFAIGTYQLVRTAGFLQYNSYGGQFAGGYYLNTTRVVVMQGSFSRGDFSSAPCVVTSSNVPQDYNSHWWYVSNISELSITVPTAGGGSVAILTGTWRSRGQFIGRGVVNPRYGNFALMQRVS
jgi:hypothetical protein